MYEVMEVDLHFTKKIANKIAIYGMSFWELE